MVLPGVRLLAGIVVVFVIVGVACADDQHDAAESAAACREAKKTVDDGIESAERALLFIRAAPDGAGDPWHPASQEFKNAAAAYGEAVELAEKITGPCTGLAGRLETLDRLLDRLSDALDR